MSTCGRGRNLLQRPKQASSLAKKPLEFSTSSSVLTPPPTTTAELSTISYFLSFLLNVLNITKTQTEVTVNRVISSYSWHSFQKRISFTILLQIQNPPHPPPPPKIHFTQERREFTRSGICTITRYSPVSLTLTWKKKKTKGK